jgi:hypothetical protein
MKKLTGQKRKEARTAAWRMMKSAERLLEMAKVVCWQVRDNDHLRRGNMREVATRLHRVRKWQQTLEAIGTSPKYPSSRVKRDN